MKTTKNEIIEATKELQEALIEAVEIDEEDKNVKLRRQANHKRLSLIRDVIRELRVE